MLVFTYSILLTIINEKKKKKKEKNINNIIIVPLNEQRTIFIKISSSPCTHNIHHETRNLLETCLITFISRPS